MSNKANNIHFGKHVFDYFPWYSYNNSDLTSLPSINTSIRDSFLFAFDEFDEMILVWVKKDDIMYSTINNGEYGMSDCILVKDGIASYKGIKESVNDWEDLEKIRLRCIIGTEKRSKNYVNILDFYKDYHDIISDAIYSETGEDATISIVGVDDLISRNEQDICMRLIEEEDVYRAIENGKYQYNSFLSSIYRYYDRNKKLSPKQVEATKKILYKEILKSTKPKTFFSVKTTLIPNLDRVTDYFDSMGLKYLKFHNFMLVY